MPNLLPDWAPWIHPAGRLIWSLLALAVAMLFVGALLRPPLERKLVAPQQAIPAIVVVLVAAVVAAKFVSSLQTVMVWLGLLAAVAIAYAAVISRDRRDPERKITWSEAMLGGTAIMALLWLVYAIIPHEWLTYANSYLNMSTDKFVKDPWWPIYNIVKLPYSALRDTVAALIYVVALGGNVVLWLKWQKRLQPRPEAAPAETGEVVRTSRFGRPLKARG